MHPAFEVLEDTRGDLTLEHAIESAAAGAFADSGAGNFSFGFTASPHWFRFSLENPETDPREMILVLRTPWLTSVSLYLPAADGGYEEKHFGDSFPFHSRDYPHHQFLVDLTVPRGNHTYYLRIANKKPFMTPVALWDPAEFHADDRERASYYGILYGAILVMFLYNAFIFLSIRDRRYLFYCLYLLSFFLMNFSYNGFSFQYFWPESPRWASWSYSTWIYLFQIAGLMFAITFLDTRVRTPRLHAWLRGFLAVLVITWLAALVAGGEVFYNASAVYFVFLYTPLVAIAGVIALLTGFRAARFFVLASMASLVGAFFTALTVAGFIPYSFAVFHAVEFGLLVDVILLALALADRINLMHDEKEQAQQYAIEQEHLAHRTLEQAKVDLERAVAKRTAELARAKELAERLARTDSLTGVSNRRFFEERANHAFSRGKRYGRSLALIVFDIDRFKQINDRFGHPAGDTVIKAVAGIAEAGVREVDFVGRIGGEEFAVLLPDVDKHQAAVTAERLRGRLGGTAIEHGGSRLGVTASFGVADLEHRDRAFEEVLSRADKAMYASKRAGRNRVSIG